ncbi:MAG: SDR family NAD(P)-dependent oxidoreductase [Acidimicrobiales bacterium]
MRALSGKVAAVTGAASGIGRALALRLAGCGMHVAVADVDDAGLADTVARCEGSGVKVTSRQLDVADRRAVHAWADDVVAAHGAAHLVCNIAGVALGATVEGMSYEDLDWLMGVNFWGVVYGTKAFLPYLREAGEGHIVNMSSVFGLISVPSQGAYNASKFAVRAYTDALRMELEASGGAVSCTTVHPGGVRTNIARNARIDDSARRLAGGDVNPERFDRIARTSPEAAARKIVDAVRANRRRVLVGPDAVFIDLVSRLPTSIYQRALVFGARHPNIGRLAR